MTSHPKYGKGAREVMPWTDLRPEPSPWPDRPCANCARRITSPSAQRCYCSELCSQVAAAIRYLRRRAADHRLGEPEIREAIRTKIAFVAAGGYQRAARRISKEVRATVIARDQETCRTCGVPGVEVDHVEGSSNDLDNLQLLCHDCHHAKTGQRLVRASAEQVATVHAPFLLRARHALARQPCDSAAWDHTRWARAVSWADSDLVANWLSWLAGQGEGALAPAQAVVGFPDALMPWSWYGVAQTK